MASSNIPTPATSAPSALGSDALERRDLLRQFLREEGLDSEVSFDNGDGSVDVVHGVNEPIVPTDPLREVTEVLRTINGNMVSLQSQMNSASVQNTQQKVEQVSGNIVISSDQEVKPQPFSDDLA